MTLFTRAQHQPLSCATSIQSMTSKSISLHPVLILSSHLWPGIPSVSFSWVNTFTMLNIIFITRFLKQCYSHFHLTNFCIWYTVIARCEEKYELLVAKNGQTFILNLIRIFPGFLAMKHEDRHTKRHRTSSICACHTKRQCNMWQKF